MTTFALISTSIGFVLYAAFVALSVAKFRWQRSYSYYAHLWTERYPINRETHLWSIVTVVVALCLAPAMIQLGKDNPWQFLGFFAPVYLMVVAFTPEYLELPDDDEKTKAKRKRQRRIHFIGTALCAVVSLVWLFLVANAWWAVGLAYLAAIVAAGSTETHNTSYILWGESALIAAVAAASIFNLLFI